MDDMTPAFKNRHELTGNELVALVVANALILLVGGILCLAGYNDRFYAGNDFLRGIFEFLTEFGNDKIYLVSFCLIYIAYDKDFGQRFYIVFFLILFVTDFLKMFFHDPRPPANLLRDSPNDGYGFPSGHATTAIAFYGYIMLSHLDAKRVKKPLMSFCLFAMIVVPVSRIVIGAHDLNDVVGACVISLTILTVYMVVRPRATEFVADWPMERRIAAGVTGTLLLFGFATLVLTLRYPDELLESLDELGPATGLLLGCAVVFPLEDAHVRYRPGKLNGMNRLQAAGIGLVMGVAVFAVMDGVCEALLPFYLEGFVAYFFFILAVGFIIPYALRRWIQDSQESGEKIESDAKGEIRE